MRCGLSYFKTAVGCDPSQGMLKCCEDLQVRHQTDLEKLPFPDESFDFVTAVCVYHHIPPDRRYLMTAEALRVLRPKGIFCIIEHNPLNPVTRLIVSRTPVDADAQLLSPRDARKVLVSARFRILDTQYFLFLPQRVHKYFASLEDRLSRIPLGGQYCMMSTCRS